MSQTPRKFTTFDDRSIYLRDPKIVRIKLRLGANPNFITRTIDSGDKVEQKNIFEDSALAFAIRNNYKHIVSLTKIFLSNKDMDVNARSIDGHTALTLLCDRRITSNNGLPVIKQLLKHPKLKVDTVIKNESGIHNPVSLAVESNNLEVLSLLISDGRSNPNATSQGLSPLHIAIHQKNLAAVRILLRAKNIDTNFKYDGKFPVELALDKKAIEIVEILLNYCKTDATVVDERGKCLIHKTLNPKIMYLLILVKDVNPNLKDSDGITPLYRLVAKKNIKCIKILKRSPKLNPNILSNKDSPLHLAYRLGYIKILREILGHKTINANIPDQEGNLLISLVTNHWIMRMLIELGVDPNTKDANQETPLYRAAKTKNRKLVTEILKAKNVDLNILCHGETALHAAYREGHESIVKQIILDKRCDAGIRDANGVSIITLIVDIDILEKLIE